MYNDEEMVLIKALTPVHVGTGDGLASVDMPIQREKHSNIPKIEASSLKGSIKHRLYSKFKNTPNELRKLYTVFGPKEGNDYASLIGFTDAKLLFFPVRSEKDIYKLVTCPYILNRWIKEINLIYKKDIQEIDSNINQGMCISNSGEKEILEEYIFELDQDKLSSSITELFKNIDQLYTDKIVILNNSDFIDLVTMYTEIITRNKIDVSTGAAEQGGLFTEEYLPSETIMYFTVLGSPSFNIAVSETQNNVLEYFNNNVDKVFQVGGDATIGKGFMQKLNFQVPKEKVGDNNA